MPELPEVENVVRALRIWEGSTLEELEIFDAKLWFESELDVEPFSGKRLERVTRRGKYLIFHFGDELFLIGHLRMTGKFLAENSEAIPQAVKDSIGKSGKGLQIRCRFRFRLGSLVFFDTRRFGTITAVKNPENFFLKKSIAPDPYESPEAGLKHFLEKMTESSRPAKAILLDQSVAAGIGNIYADEALFAAGIDPRTPAKKIKDPKKIWDLALAIMARSMAEGGTTIIDYAGVNGESGRYGAKLKVYGRDGQACLNCSAKIKLIRIAGRSTHFCSVCQTRGGRDGKAPSKVARKKGKLRRLK
jgi:formamidopyrimidine-DNA glycosylase